MTKEPWHLDKRVPIALIVTIALQTAGIVWWAASLEHRVARVEREVGVLAASDAKLVDDTRRITEFLARLDERIIAMTATLKEVRDELKARK